MLNPDYYANGHVDLLPDKPKERNHPEATPSTFFLVRRSRQNKKGMQMV
jgi:hypothetical protein